jgi:hypothetical protein
MGLAYAVRKGNVPASEVGGNVLKAAHDTEHLPTGELREFAGKVEGRHVSNHGKKALHRMMEHRESKE